MINFYTNEKIRVHERVKAMLDTIHDVKITINNLLTPSKIKTLVNVIAINLDKIY